MLLLLSINGIALTQGLKLEDFVHLGQDWRLHNVSKLRLGGCGQEGGHLSGWLQQLRDECCHLLSSNNWYIFMSCLGTCSSNHNFHGSTALPAPNPQPNLPRPPPLLLSLLPALPRSLRQPVSIATVEIRKPGGLALASQGKVVATGKCTFSYSSRTVRSRRGWGGGSTPNSIDATTVLTPPVGRSTPPISH